MIIRLIIIALIAAISLPSCKMADKLIDNMVAGLYKNEDTLRTYISNLSQSAMLGALEEIKKDSNYAAVRKQLNTVVDDFMLRFRDSLDLTAKELVENLVGNEAQQRLDSIQSGFLLTLAQMENELLDEEIPDFISRLIQIEIRQGILGTIDALREEVTSEETARSLALLRQRLQPQIDSLLLQSLAAVTSDYDENLEPRISAVISDLKNLGEETKGSAVDVIWLILGGLAGLIVLGALVYQFIWRKRYKEMIKVFTKNIDRIEQQATYDNLVQSITKDLDARDLEEPLRYILDEQKLLDQPEWKDKDQQVLRILAEGLSKAHKEGGVQQWDVITKELLEKAREAGLEEHMASILGRGKVE